MGLFDDLATYGTGDEELLAEVRRRRGERTTGGSRNKTLEALKSYESRVSAAEGLGLNDVEGEGDKGLLQGLGTALSVPSSTVFGLLNLGTGEDKWLSTGERLKRAVSGEKRYGSENFEALKRDDDDGKLEVFGKAATRFTLDTVADPLSKVRAGGSVLGRAGGSEVVESFSRNLFGRGAVKLDDAGKERLAELGRAHWRSRVLENADDATEETRAIAEAARKKLDDATTVEELAQDGLAYGAAQAYLTQGSHGLRKFLTDDRVLGAKKGEEAFRAYPRDLQGGLRVQLPGLGVNAAGETKLRLPFSNTLPKAFGAGGGGKMLGKTETGEQLLNSLNKARLAAHSNRVVRAAGDNMGGKLGAVRGDVFEDAYKGVKEQGLTPVEQLLRAGQAAPRSNASLADEAVKAAEERAIKLGLDDEAVEAAGAAARADFEKGLLPQPRVFPDAEPGSLRAAVRASTTPKKGKAVSDLNVTRYADYAVLRNVGNEMRNFGRVLGREHQAAVLGVTNALVDGLSKQQQEQARQRVKDLVADRANFGELVLGKELTAEHFDDPVELAAVKAASGVFAFWDRKAKELKAAGVDADTAMKYVPLIAEDAEKLLQKARGKKGVQGQTDTSQGRDAYIRVVRTDEDGGWTLEPMSAVEINRKLGRQAYVEDPIKMMTAVGSAVNQRLSHLKVAELLDNSGILAPAASTERLVRADGKHANLNAATAMDELLDLAHRNALLTGDDELRMLAVTERENLLKIMEDLSAGTGDAEQAVKALLDVVTEFRTRFGEKALRERLAAKAPKEPTGHILYRRMNPDVEDSTPSSRAQGLYTSLVQGQPHAFISPHLDAGTADRWYEAATEGVLEVPQLRLQHERFKFLGGENKVSAGIAALSQLSEPDEMAAYLRMSKDDLLQLFAREFPDLDLSRYQQDAYELLEVLGAAKARAAGYKAIMQADEDMPQFSEFVALSDDALRELGDKPPLMPSRGAGTYETPDENYIKQLQDRLAEAQAEGRTTTASELEYQLQTELLKKQRAAEAPDLFASKADALDPKQVEKAGQRYMRENMGDKLNDLRPNALLDKETAVDLKDAQLLTDAGLTRFGNSKNMSKQSKSVKGAQEALDKLDPQFAPEEIMRIVDGYFRPNLDSGMFEQTFTTFMSVWRTSATISRGPAFVIRNLIGGMWNNSLRGVDLFDYRIAAKVIKAEQQAEKDARRIVDRGLKLPKGVEAEAVKDLTPEERVGYLIDHLVTQRLRGRKVGEYDLAEVYKTSTQHNIDSTSALDMFRTPNGMDSAMAARQRENYLKGQGTDVLGLQGPLGDGQVGVAGKLGEAAVNNPWTRWVVRRNDTTERFLRMAAYSHGAREFGLADGGYGASSLVKALQFDYSDLSAFEGGGGATGWARLVAPFYTFTRRSLPLQLRAIAFEPGKLAKLERFQNTAEQDLGAESPYSDLPLSDLARNRDSFVSGIMGTGGPLVIGSESPANDLNTWFKFGGKSLNPFDWINEQGAASMINPFFQAGAEHFSGTDFATGAKFDESGTEADPTFRMLAKLPGVPDTWTDSAGKTVGDSSLINFWKGLVPQANFIDNTVLSTASYGAEKAFGTELPGFLRQSDKSNDRRASNILSGLFGLPVQTVTDAQVRGEVRSRSDTLDARIDRRIGELGLDPQLVREELRRSGPDGLRLAIQAGHLRAARE